MITFISRNSEDIRQIVAEFKREHQILFSNYFGVQQNVEYDVYQGERTVLIRKNEDTFNRLYIITSDLDDLKNLLLILDKGQYVLNIPTKENIKKECALLNDSGFYQIGEYVRLSNIDLRGGYNYLSEMIAPIQNSLEVEYAIEDDEQAIFDLLYVTFDKRVDYLPTHKELKEMIEQNQVLVLRDELPISGVLIYTIIGKKCYENAWVDVTGNGLLLMHKLYELMVENKIVMTNFWVRKDNKPVLLAHKRLGATFDGITDYTFAN